MLYIIRTEEDKWILEYRTKDYDDAKKYFEIKKQSYSNVKLIEEPDNGK